MEHNDNVLTIIGVSPRNSYYSNSENIAFALHEVLRDHGKAFVMIPDVPDIDNYLAYGYAEAKARKKASELGHAFKKSVHEICKSLNISCADAGASSAQVRIINWAEEIDKSPLYQQEFAAVKALYQTNSSFRKDVQAATMQSLNTRMDHNSDTKKYIEKTGISSAVTKAVRYPLAELAFLTVASKLFGGERAEYVYHRNWDFYEKFIRGSYSGQRPANLGFRILNHTEQPQR